MRQHHRARGIPCAPFPFTRGRDTQNPELQNPPRKAGLHTRRSRRSSYPWQEQSFPEIPEFNARPVSCHGQIMPRAGAFRARCCRSQGGQLCSASSLSRSTYTAAFAGTCIGRCRTSWRSLTAPGGAFPLSARSPRPQGSRVARCPAISCNLPRRASSRASGVLAASTPTSSPSRFLPAQRGVSHQRERGVPPAGTEEQTGKKTGTRDARDSPNRGMSFGEIPDERSKWEARLRSLAQVRLLAAVLGREAGQPQLHRTDRAAAGTGLNRRNRIRDVSTGSLRMPERGPMSISKHQRPRWAPPPRPPYRPITDEERREDALIEERLHQLFGPPSIVHQGNVR